MGARSAMFPDWRPLVEEGRDAFPHVVEARQRVEVDALGGRQRFGEGQVAAGGHRSLDRAQPRGALAGQGGGAPGAGAGDAAGRAPERGDALADGHLGASPPGRPGRVKPPARPARVATSRTSSGGPSMVRVAARAWRAVRLGCMAWSRLVSRRWRWVARRRFGGAAMTVTAAASVAGAAMGVTAAASVGGAA